MKTFDLPFKKNGYVWLNRRQPLTFSNKAWTYKESSVEVRFMADSGGYAMVRRKGCFPFVASLKDLSLEPKYKPE